MTGIYYITNKINNKKYIGSSIDVQKRLSTHFSRLKNNNHPNKYLQSAVLKYGLDNFEGKFIEECEADDLLDIEQDHINSNPKDQLYNLTFITGAGGYDSLSKECYLLGLDGNIQYKFDSIMDCSREINVRINVSHSIDSGAIIKNKYRLVTINFYNNNLELIKSWKNYSCKTKERSKNYKLRQFLILEIDDKIIEFNNKKEVADYLNISIERVRQVLINSNSKKYKIKFKYNV